MYLTFLKSFNYNSREVFVGKKIYSDFTFKENRTNPAGKEEYFHIPPLRFMKITDKWNT